MPAVLSTDINQQNICCEKVLNILRQSREGVTLTYRSMIKSRQWDNYCKLTGANYDQAFQDLDSTITIPQDILLQIGYKYQCTELCPFPCCLDDIKCWEWDLIKNYKTISDILSWCAIGMRHDKIAQWHSIPVESVRKWNHKRIKIAERDDIYKGFQDYLDFIK
jgi:hypothetical protein